jgi:hypothetical protein
MQRLVLYSGCAAALALAAWLVVGTLEPGAGPRPEAQSVAAAPETPPTPGSEQRVAASLAPPLASALPPAPQRNAPREPEATAEALEPAHVSAALQPLSQDDPVRELLDASWPDDTETAGRERPAPIHRAAPQRDRFPESDRSPETVSPTPPPTRAPPPIFGGVLAVAPPPDPVPIPTVSGPDVVEVLPPRDDFGTRSGTGTSVGTWSGTEGGLGPDRVVPPAESFVDPDLPAPVQDVVRQDILTKQGQVTDWTGGR